MAAAMTNLWQDLRYSARLLVKHPGFTLTAIGVLMLGIGVNAGIFGIVNGLMIRPLNHAHPDGAIVGLFSKDRTTERGYRAFSYPEFDDVRTAKGPFAYLAAHNVALAGITENGATRQTLVDVISANYFTTLGVQPVYGRDFTADEEHPGTTARSVIVSYVLWQRSGFDRDILKTIVRINGEDYGVVGVAPQGFTGTTAIIGTEYFLPIGVHDAIESDFDSRDRFAVSDRRNHSLMVFGQLKPGVAANQANEQMKPIAAAHEQAYPAENKNQDLVLRPLGRLGLSTSPQDDPQLWVPMSLLQGLAAAVLLTSCLNLANMMLAFGSARQKEIAIRLAIGGRRSRIIRELLIQGLLLSLAGGALGLITASWLAQLLVATVSTALPVSLALNLTPDFTVLAATLMFCSLATIAFGLWPALRLSRPDLLTSLKDHAGEVSGRLGTRVTVRGALVTVQIALSLALLVLSGLFVRSAAAGASADPGFAIEPLVVAQIDPRLGGYDDARSREARRAVLERLRATPGIEAVAASTIVPFGDYTNGAVVQREGPRLRSEDPAARGKIANALEYIVTADYFRTLGLPMLRGREFTTADESGEGGTLPVVIDKALADKLFAGDDPVGQMLQFGADSGTADSKPMLIVGVVPTLRHDLFETKPEPHIYRPSGTAASTRMFLFARAASQRTGDSVVTAVRDELRAVDPNLPVIFVKSFRAQHEGSAQMWILRAAAKLFLSLGLAAAFVAVIGLYGVRSYLVTRRRREFGVRMAVGASPLDVLRLVMREAAVTTAVGLVIGVGLGVLLGWGLSFLIFGVSPFDPVTLGGATGVLALASLAASIVPARRAATVMPMTALRDE